MIPNREGVTDSKRAWLVGTGAAMTMGGSVVSLASVFWAASLEKQGVPTTLPKVLIWFGVVAAFIGAVLICRRWGERLHATSDEVVIEMRRVWIASQFVLPLAFGTMMLVLASLLILEHSPAADRTLHAAKYWSRIAVCLFLFGSGLVALWQFVRKLREPTRFILGNGVVTWETITGKRGTSSVDEFVLGPRAGTAFTLKLADNSRFSEDRDGTILHSEQRGSRWVFFLWKAWRREDLQRAMQMLRGMPYVKKTRPEPRLPPTAVARTGAAIVLCSAALFWLGMLYHASLRNRGMPTTPADTLLWAAAIAVFAGAGLIVMGERRKR